MGGDDIGGETTLGGDEIGGRQHRENVGGPYAMHCFRAASILRAACMAWRCARD
jgi:hypothetical protein